MNERLPYLRDKTRRLTTSPGVYLMKDKSGKVIYVGKAKNLRNRVTSYFRENAQDPLEPHQELLPKVYKMVSHVQDYDFIVTDTEYEALVLECSLIKQYDPKYNILLKDGKGYHYIKISEGPYPRLTAEKVKEDSGTYIGPYVSSFTVQQAVSEAVRVFRLPTCSRKFPQELRKGRPCLNYHIKQCMGLCRGRISAEDYQRTVDEAVHYIRHGSVESIERMQKQMEQAAEEMDFEWAATLRDRIAAIRKAADTQKIVTEMKDTDVVAAAENGQVTCASVLIYRNGRLQDKAVYFLGENDTGLLEDFVVQYYASRTDFPREILLEEEPSSPEILHQFLKERSGRSIPVTVPKRGEGVKLVQLAKSNASEYLSLQVGRTGKEIVALEELGKLLGLAEPPQYIEAYDISNLASQSMVAGMVVFENGRPLKSAYKRFSIKEVAIQNDYACMREVLSRRFRHYLEDTRQEGEPDEGFSRLPDLILVDGGKGQVGAVEPILRRMGIAVPVYGMVKDNKHRTRAIAAAGEEISVSDKQRAFALLTQIQDEVHRFSITYQRKVHKKQSFQLELTRIQGVGEKKALALIQRFKTREALLQASPEELAKAAKVSAAKGEEIFRFLQEEHGERQID